MKQWQQSILKKSLSIIWRSLPMTRNWERFWQRYLFRNCSTKYTSMDDLIWRSGFGIMNLLEVEQVNQDKWNEYIARNTECKTWHEFGKLAMIDWMKHKLEEAKQAKN